MLSLSVSHHGVLPSFVVVPWVRRALLIAIAAAGACIVGADLCEEGQCLVDVDADGIALLQREVAVLAYKAPRSGGEATMAVGIVENATTKQRVEANQPTVAAAQEMSNTSSATFLPSVECVRVISLEGSPQLPMQQADLIRLGLWDRTIVQTEQRDPEGGEAGCFRAHVRAWEAGLAAGCSTLLVLEDDAFFDNASLDVGSSRAETFMKTDVPYDLLMLGWFANGRCLRSLGDCITRVDGAECVFEVQHGVPTTHAYVITQDGMRKIKGLKYSGNPVTKDMSFFEPPLRVVTVRPAFAFTRNHVSSIPVPRKYLGVQQAELKVRSNPPLFRAAWEDPTYKSFGVMDCGLE